MIGYYASPANGGEKQYSCQTHHSKELTELLAVTLKTAVYIADTVLKNALQPRAFQNFINKGHISRACSSNPSDDAL